jgi:hypothetical protein
MTPPPRDFFEQGDDHMDDTHPGGLVDRRAAHHARRRFVRWDPTFSMGSVGLILTWLFSMMVGYGVYTADKKDQENKTTQLRLDVDKNREQLSRSLEGIQVEVKEVSKILQGVSTDLAVVKARQEQPRRVPEQR